MDAVLRAAGLVARERTGRETRFSAPARAPARSSVALGETVARR